MYKTLLLNYLFLTGYIIRKQVCRIKNNLNE